MEGKCKSLFRLLQYVIIITIGCFVQNAYGDHFFISKQASCLNAIINCLMDYDGVLAYEPHLEQYEQDTGCSTAHLAIWLWNRQPYTCKFKKGNTQINDGNTSTENTLSTTSAGTSISKLDSHVQETKETHRYICVTNGVMGSRRDLCDPDTILNTINAENMKSYFEESIGVSVSAVAILAFMVLVVLYKRRTRERPTPYWPHSNKSENGTETTTINYPQCSVRTQNEHHYTLPTKPSVDNVNLVRPAIRKITDARAWASEADIYSLPYQHCQRPHRGLCFKTSLGNKSGAISAPDVHIYDSIKRCKCSTCPESTCKCKIGSSTRKNSSKLIGDNGYLEFPISGAVSVPNLHLYEKLKPCSCANIKNKTGPCNCITYTSLRPKNNTSDEVKKDIDFRVLTGAVSAPDIHLYDELTPCNCTYGQGKICNCTRYTNLRPKDNTSDEIAKDIDIRILSGSVSAPDIHLYDELKNL